MAQEQHNAANLKFPDHSRLSPDKCTRARVLRNSVTVCLKTSTTRQKKPLILVSQSSAQFNLAFPVAVNQCCSEYPRDDWAPFAMSPALTEVLLCVLLLFIMCLIHKCWQEQISPIWKKEMLQRQKCRFCINLQLQTVTQSKCGSKSLPPSSQSLFQPQSEHQHMLQALWRYFKPGSASDRSIRIRTAVINQPEEILAWTLIAPSNRHLVYCTLASSHFVVQQGHGGSHAWHIRTRRFGTTF